MLINRRTPAATHRPGPEVLEFHRGLAGYEPTRLLAFDRPSEAPRVGRLLVKAETTRFGLPAFKALGASWATARVLGARLGPAAPWHDLEQLRAAVRAQLGDITLVAATDGNHGRAVAWMARLLGQRAVILVPAGTVPARIEAIESEGAEVRVVAGTYDDAVAASAALAGERTFVVSDTSWPGYEDPPRWVIEGYSTIFAELDSQLAPYGGWAGVDVLVVPLGVGAFGASAAAHLDGAPRPVVLGVEPTSAGCCLAAVEAGHVVEVPGPHDSIMAGLNCGQASMLALPALRSGFDAFVTITDDQCRSALRWLAGAGLEVGECGAAGLAGLAELEAHPGALDLPEGATALVIATEGVTDPAGFEAIVGRPPS